MADRENPDTHQQRPNFQVDSILSETPMSQALPNNEQVFRAIPLIRPNFTPDPNLQEVNSKETTERVQRVVDALNNINSSEDK